MMNRTGMATRRQWQRGQALTEFLVVAVALLQLFLLVPLIAKYQDVNHAVQVASRYAAFDAAARNDGVNSWKDPEQLAGEVRRRFFSNVDAPIKTGDAAGNFRAHQNPFWRGPRDEPLIEDVVRDVRLTFGVSRSPAQAGSLAPASDGRPFVLHHALDLGAEGLFTANVSVTLVNMPEDLRFYQPFDAIDLGITRSTSVLVDPWTARGPQDIEQRILHDATVFPAGRLTTLGAVFEGAVGVIDGIPSEGRVRAPMLGQLEFWRDVVPDDRLRARP